MNEDVNSCPQLANTSALATIEGDRQPKKRYKLYGSDTNGAPFRLKAGDRMPHFKSDDQPHNQPQEVMDAHARVFDFAKPDDVAAYDVVIDIVAKQRAMISKDEINWDEKSGAYKAFLRWVELFLEKPSTGVNDG